MTRKETATQRKRRLEARRAKRRNESQEQRDIRLEKDRMRHKHIRSTESQESREIRLEKVRSKLANNKASQTVSEKEARQEQDRNNKAVKRTLETDSERCARLEKDRTNKAAKRAVETSVERNTRLEKKRLRYVQSRTSIAATSLADTFEQCINTFCSQACEICTKLCYPKQIFNVHISRVAFSYLPSALTCKPTLALCSRCKTHVTSKTTVAPSKSYWNNLNPGSIPNDILVLSQAEQRLLARVIPFLKIIKFDGIFGQYGFKGQAVLFAQDIFEVTEKIPTILPREVGDIGMLVVTENLQNLNITREFSISRSRVYEALRWLMENNPLYSDVTINENVHLNNEDLVSEVTGEMDKNDGDNQMYPEQIRTEYVPINNNARIIRASWHQGNNEIFTSGYAGAQCCVMVLSNIVRASLTPPSQWNIYTLNANMIEADAKYTLIRAHNSYNNSGHPITADGFLEVQHFKVIKNHFIMFNNSFSIDFEENTLLIGSLQDDINDGIVGKKLYDNLRALFSDHRSGLLIANSKSYGVLNYEDKFYFTDSHSCGAKGAPAKSNGRACIVECDSIEEVHRICRRAVGFRNQPYTLNHIDVVLKSPIVTNIAPESEPAQPTVAQLEQMPIQTSVMAPIDCIQPAVEEELVVSENAVEIKRKTKDNIVNEAHELKAEEFAWFFLFPYGINGFKQNRPVRITPLDYFQYRILGSDTRFQRNDYLFYSLSMFEYYRVKSTITACMKKVEGRDGKVEDLHLYLKNLRGSAAYWKTSLNELISQIRCLGPPTYFLTFSSNDLNWLDMRKALLIADGRPDVDPATLDIHSTQQLIEQYPVIISRHFMIRVNALLQFLKNNHDVLGGKLQDYFWRIEFQNRGSPHLHMVVWIENYPTFDTPEGIQINL